MAGEELLAQEVLVAQNFFLEIDGQVLTYLSSVSGLDVEVDVATTAQAGPNGKIRRIRTAGSRGKGAQLTLTRSAPVAIDGDKLWEWFNTIVKSGPHGNRKTGAVVVYEPDGAEVSRYTFTDAWPSKIATDQFSVDSNDITKETITLETESLARTK